MNCALLRIVKELKNAIGILVGQTCCKFQIKTFLDQYLWNWFSFSIADALCVCSLENLL